MAEDKSDNKSDFANVMLITANVGSIFEDPKNLLKIWTKEFLKKVDEQKPDFLAVHCQEVGGKNYEESMKHVEDFIRTILESTELKDYDKVCIFLDEDFTSTVQFTALGSIYFIHKSITNLKVFDFQKKEYIDVKGHIVHAGNIENVAIKEKSKFPQEFFPECKWSRKGFMRTRWDVNGTKFDLVNIHLFHDASNLIALKESPSPYCMNRQNALKYTLDRFKNDEYEKLPCFIFGDLNFRLNISTLVKKLTEHCEQINSEEKGKKESILFKKNVQDEAYLTLGQKVFDFKDSDKTFNDKDNLKWLSEHDNELDTFKDLLFELPKTFPPSYPFTEDLLDSKYMKTRIPSWCDRVLFTKMAQDLIMNNDNSNIIYDMIGLKTPMGDHKPILLRFKLPIQIPTVKATENQAESISIAPESKEETGETPQSSDQADQSKTDLEKVAKDNLSNLSLGEEESNSNVNTRYVCVKNGDEKVAVFRETAV